jgi:hypothetical protein
VSGVAALHCAALHCAALHAEERSRAVAFEIDRRVRYELDSEWTSPIEFAAGCGLVSHYTQVIDSRWFSSKHGRLHRFAPFMPNIGFSRGSAERGL